MVLSVVLKVSLVRFRLFWSDWDTSGIHSVDKDTGKDVVTIAQGLERPTGFAVFKATPPGLLVLNSSSEVENGRRANIT